MKALLFTAILFASSPLVALGGTLAFEVASVKPAQAAKGPGLRVSVSQDKGRITMSNVSLKNLLTQAYKLREHQLTGPDWMDIDRYDVVATLPEGATRDQVPEMLQTLLADRFKLTIHKEPKVLPVYALVATKSGPKLHPAEAAEASLSMKTSPKGREMKGKVTMARLADVLSSAVGRPVVDMTEIEGTFDVDLAWSPDESDPASRKIVAIRASGPDGGGEKGNDLSDSPTIFIALQEKMGLKLEARKAPLDVIVVDHAEKVPTEN